MSQENVVPFDPSPRVGMARRGAPDKSHTVTSETAEVDCPHCGAVLCLEVRLLGVEVLCVGCDTLIALHPRAVEVQR